MNQLCPNGTLFAQEYISNETETYETKERREGQMELRKSTPKVNLFQNDPVTRSGARPPEGLPVGAEHSVSHPFSPAGCGRRGSGNVAGGRIRRASDSGRLALISKLCLASFLIVVIMTVVTYLSGVDKYTVETKLLFISPEQKNTIAWPLEKEVEGLKSSQLIFLLARDLCKESETGATRNVAWNFEATSSGPAAFDTRAGAVGGVTEFMRWFSDELVVESNVAPGKAAVTLRLRGDDPEFLKTVLNAYVRRYSDYRRGMEGETALDFFRPAGKGEPGSPYASLDSIQDQLQKIDFQQRECELAMKLLDSRKGAFGGFFPAAKIEGVPTLAHFQQKIVELEIAKRSLSVRYTPKSREIRNIDLEMQGVRSAMRECLSEHLHFLEKGKDLLIGQKAELERLAPPGERCGKGPCSGRLPNGDAWFSLAGGLRVIQDKPSVSKKPMLVKASEYKNALSALLSAPPGSSAFPHMEDRAERQFEAPGKDAEHKRNDHVSSRVERATAQVGERNMAWRAERKTSYDKAAPER
jgi:hypothetical protein